MGWRERDYSQASEGEMLRGVIRRPPPAAFALVILHSAAFVLALMLQSDASGIRLGLRGESLHPWAILLFPLSTTNLLSAIVNVLICWSLGGALERRVGSARLIAWYIAGNLAAGLAYFAAAAVNPGLAVVPLETPAGGFATWVLAAWFLLRDQMASFFGWITSAAKLWAIFGGIGAALVVLGGQLGAAAWLAGVAAGLATYFAVPASVRFSLPRPRPRRVRVVRPSIPVTPVSEPQLEAAGLDIDPILEKISRSGIASLTPSEKNQLEAARRRLSESGLSQ